MEFYVYVGGEEIRSYILMILIASFTTSLIVGQKGLGEKPPPQSDGGLVDGGEGGGLPLGPLDGAPLHQCAASWSPSSPQGFEPRPLFGLFV